MAWSSVAASPISGGRWVLGGGVVNRVVKPSSVRRHAARSVSISSTLEYWSAQLEGHLQAVLDVRHKACTVSESSMAVLCTKNRRCSTKVSLPEG